MRLGDRPGYRVCPLTCARFRSRGKNAPSSENLVELVHHSDEVLEAFLLIAGRHEILTMKKLLGARDTLVQMISLIDKLVAAEIDESG